MTSPELPPSKPGGLRGSLLRLTEVEEAELPQLLWSVGLFFCVLCGYFVLRPLRETFGLAIGPNYNWLWTGTAVGTLVATPVFGYFANRVPKLRLVRAVYWVGIVTILAFWIGYTLAPVDAGGDGDRVTLRVGIGYAFYIWLSVFNLFATAVFWALMVDSWRESQSRRVFGVIAVGGSLGALVGGVLVSWLNPTFGVGMLLASIPFFAAGLVCVGGVERAMSTHEHAHEARTGVRLPGWDAAIQGVQLFARSRYLLAIGLFLAAQTFVAAILYIQARGFLAAELPTRNVPPEVATANRALRTEVFAYQDIAYNVLTLIVQLVLTGRLIRWFGLSVMLAILPLLNFAIFGALAFLPVLTAYLVLEVLQKIAKFAVMKPSREVLFTVVSRDEKYQAKQFLDTAVYRSTDALWAWLQNGMVSLFGAFGVKVAVVMPVCVGWAGIGIWLGRAERTRRVEADAPIKDSVGLP